MFNSFVYLRTLYFTLVRPVLEYGGHCLYLGRTCIIRLVQNKFLSRFASIFNIGDHPRHGYSFMRNMLNILTLSSRRHRCRFVGLYFLFLLYWMNLGNECPRLFFSISFSAFSVYFYSTTTTEITIINRMLHCISDIMNEINYCTYLTVVP